MRDALLLLPAREGSVLRILPETLVATALEIAMEGPGQVAIATREGIAARHTAVGRFVATGAHHLVPEVPLEHDRRIETIDDRHTIVAIGLTAAIAEAAASRLLPTDWYATVADAAVWVVRLGPVAKVGMEEVDTAEEAVVIRDGDDTIAIRCRMAGRGVAAFEPVAPPLHRQPVVLRDALAVVVTHPHARLGVGMAEVGRAQQPFYGPGQVLGHLAALTVTQRQMIHRVRVARLSADL